MHLQTLLSKQGGFGRPSKQVLTLVLLWLRVGMWTIPEPRSPWTHTKGLSAPEISLRSASLWAEEGAALFGGIVWPPKAPHSFLEWPATSQRGARLGAAGPCPRVSWDYAFMAEGRNRSVPKRVWNPWAGHTGLWGPKWAAEKIPTALVCRFLSLSQTWAERGLLWSGLRTHTPCCSPDGHVKPVTAVSTISEDETKTLPVLTFQLSSAITSLLIWEFPEQDSAHHNSS